MQTTLFHILCVASKLSLIFVEFHCIAMDLSTGDFLVPYWYCIRIGSVTSGITCNKKEN